MTAEMDTRASPLGSRLPAIGGLAVREIAYEGRIGLRGEGEQFHRAVRTALGFALPMEASKVAAGQGRRALWLGPDEWLIVTPDAERPAVLDGLAKELAGLHAAVVDLSASRTVIEIEGAGARTLLEKGCYLDLDPGAFKPGQCLSTTIAKTGVVVEQTGVSPPSYRIYMRPSFARHFAAWIAEAGRDLTD